MVNCCTRSGQTGFIIIFVKSYKIYGIGSNEYGQFGFENEIESNDYSDTVRQWQTLYQMESLIDDYIDISLYCETQSILIKQSNNSLYVAGDNKNDHLGVDTDGEIYEFTRIQLKILILHQGEVHVIITHLY